SNQPSNNTTLFSVSERTANGEQRTAEFQFIGQQPDKLKFAALPRKKRRRETPAAPSHCIGIQN
ncbi:MAG: hypothetical protein IK108_00345, partial [Clostridia bacterium]|nr:hypothetical protein [Clostridia bacterium]